jgi:mono/diheme cytochrome c family protein
MPRWTLALAVILVAHLSLEAVANQAKAATGKTSNPPAATPKSVAAGEKVFRTYCRMCHGNDAKGNGPQAPPGSHPPNLTDDTWNHGASDAEILEVIRSGVGPKFDMKGFRSRLTDDEMWSVIHYLRSLHASSPH